MAICPPSLVFSTQSDPGDVHTTITHTPSNDAGNSWRPCGDLQAHFQGHLKLESKFWRFWMLPGGWQPCLAEGRTLSLRQTGVSCEPAIKIPLSVKCPSSMALLPQSAPVATSTSFCFTDPKGRGENGTGESRRRDRHEHHSPSYSSPPHFVFHTILLLFGV